MQRFATMSQQPDQPEVRRTGRFMLILAWLGGIFLLTLLFQDILESRLNPNAKPLVRVGEEGGSEVVLERNSQGHYVASGLINGYPVIFLLDTGATDVAIPEALADRLRLQRRRGGVSQTANGPVAVWQTVLDEVGLGSIRLNRIRASILPSMPADSPVLLGMSFLKQLEFTQKDRQLILRQTGS
jgi:aspartyl protease family protein